MPHSGSSREIELSDNTYSAVDSASASGKAKSLILLLSIGFAAGIALSVYFGVERVRLANENLSLATQVSSLKDTSPAISVNLNGAQTAQSGKSYPITYTPGTTLNTADYVSLSYTSDSSLSCSFYDPNGQSISSNQLQMSSGQSSATFLIECGGCSAPPCNVEVCATPSNGGALSERGVSSTKFALGVIGTSSLTVTPDISLNPLMYNIPHGMWQFSFGVAASQSDILTISFSGSLGCAFSTQSFFNPIYPAGQSVAIAAGQSNLTFYIQCQSSSISTTSINPYVTLTVTPGPVLTSQGVVAQSVTVLGRDFCPDMLFGGLDTENLNTDYPAFKALFASMNQQAQRVVTSGFRASMNYVVTYGNKTIFSASYGPKALSQPNGNQTNLDTIYRIGSVTKAFTAVAAFHAEANGILNMDDPIQNYIPGFSINNPFSVSAGNITLRMLASQTSGLPRELACSTPVICDVTQQEALAAISQEFLVYPPGLRASYSNLGFALLGHAIEGALNNTMTYEEYITRNILMPLGMTNTGFNTSAVIDQMAFGSVPQSRSIYETYWNGPAGQMYSTANDLAKFVKFLNGFGPSGILDPAILRQISMPSWLTGDNLGAVGAASWESFYGSGYLARMKGGSMPPYNSEVSFIPELGLGMAVVYVWNDISKAMAAPLLTGSSVYNYIIPAFFQAFQSSLSSNATVPITGSYTVVPGSGQVAATIVQTSSGLILTISGSQYLLSSVPRVSTTPSCYVMRMSQVGLPCFTNFELGMNSWALFDLTNSPLWFMLPLNDGTSTVFYLM